MNQATPAHHAERLLIHQMLDGIYPIGGKLPPERALAMHLGVTRPTLREALGRLARDGWLLIRQGKPTLVNDYWRHGGLNVLAALVKAGREPQKDLIVHLLAVRGILAPAYTATAVICQADQVLKLLADLPSDEAEAYAQFDWDLHHGLTVASGNPIYSLILNGFREIYAPLSRSYFKESCARDLSRSFYLGLRACCLKCDSVGAQDLTKKVMEQSAALWESQEKAPVPAEASLGVSQ